MVALPLTAVARFAALGALCAFGACQGGRPHEAPPALKVAPLDAETLPLQVDCHEGDSFRELGALGRSGHWYAVVGHAGVARSLAVTRDGGRTWDRAPLYLDGAGPTVVGDAMLVAGDRGSGVEHLMVRSDLTLEALAFERDPSGRLPPGAWVSKHAGLWIGVTLEGWYRFSGDAGATWTGSARALDRRLHPRLLPPTAATAGDRALVQSALPLQHGLEDHVLQYSVDGGQTWAGLSASDAALLVTPPDEVGLGLVGDAGVVLFAGSQPPRAVLMSPDHGATWTVTEMTATHATVLGPGPGELWSMQPSGLVQHTDDFGATWRLWRLMAGDVEVVADLRGELRGGVVDVAGRPVFHATQRTCTVVAQVGRNRAEVPRRDDGPGQIALWSRGGAVPMPEPGVSGDLAGLSTTAHGFAEDIVHIERDASGDLYALFAPADGVDRLGGPPMEVWRFSGHGASATVVQKYRFDNLRERRGASSQPSPYYLDAWHFQVRPDGVIRIHADHARNFDLTAAPGEQVGYGGYRGRWGDDGAGGYAYVSADAPASSFFHGVLTRWRTENQDLGPCHGASGGQEDCYVMTAGGVQDFAVHGGFVWVLDGLNGVVWRRALDGRTGAWERVLEGLLEPLQLWHTMDPADPGMYVLEQSHWWRFVPGAEPVRRVRGTP